LFLGGAVLGFGVSGISSLTLLSAGFTGGIIVLGQSKPERHAEALYIVYLTIHTLYIVVHMVFNVLWFG